MAWASSASSSTPTPMRAPRATPRSEPRAPRRRPSSSPPARTSRSRARCGRSAQPDPDVVADAIDELAHLARELAVGRRDEDVAAWEGEALELEGGEVGLG